jgi:hypothetical protein
VGKKTFPIFSKINYCEKGISSSKIPADFDLLTNQYREVENSEWEKDLCGEKLESVVERFMYIMQLNWQGGNGCTKK